MGFALHKIGLAEPQMCIALHWTDFTKVMMVIVRHSKDFAPSGKDIQLDFSGNY